MTKMWMICSKVSKKQKNVKTSSTELRTYLTRLIVIVTKSSRANLFQIHMGMIVSMTMLLREALLVTLIMFSLLTWRMLRSSIIRLRGSQKKIKIAVSQMKLRKIRKGMRNMMSILMMNLKSNHRLLELLMCKVPLVKVDYLH